MSESPNLYQRILGVMATMGAVGKGGQASYGDHYAYHRIDDIDDKLREALIEHGVVMMIVDVIEDQLERYQEPPDKYGKTKTVWYCQCKIVIELVNADNPSDRCQIKGWGQGLDNSDKATGKAQSYAAKAAYLSAFHLRGQPDNEEDNIDRGVLIISQQASLGKEKPVQEKPVAVKTEEQRKWIDRFHGCDNVTALEGAEKEFRDQPKELQSSIEPVFTESHKRCWMLDMDRTDSVEKLREFKARLANKPEVLRAPLRVFYQNKEKALMQAAKQ